MNKQIDHIIQTIQTDRSLSAVEKQILVNRIEVRPTQKEIDHATAQVQDLPNGVA